MNVSNQINLFYSYAHIDAELKDELGKHLSLLRKDGFIIQCYDGNRISPGRNIVDEIYCYLDEAHMILLLISADYLASDYHSSIEMAHALERHRRGEACVIPIILRPTHWEVTPLRELQALPTGGRAITLWSNRDEAFVNVVEGIHKVVERLTANDPPVPSTPVPPNSVAITSIILNPVTHTSVPSVSKYLRWVYISLVGIILSMLVLGSVFLVLSVLPKPSPDLFPALCSGNFQSTNTTIVNTPDTSTSPDGGPIGLSEGANIFDLQRSNEQVVQYKLQAAQATTKDPQNVVPSLKNAIGSDQADAEVQIYLENWQVLGSNHPHITFVVGVSFASSSTAASRGILQGAYTAQKECNDRNWKDESKTLIVLMIANVGGDGNGNIDPKSAILVADQIFDQAHKDPTIVGIMGWPVSAATIDVQTELKTKGSNLPMLAACSSSDYLTGTAHFFRICPKDADHAQIAVDFVLKTKQKKRIGILYQSASSFPDSLQRDLFNDLSKAKANIVGQESYAAGNWGDLQTALKNVLTQKPDAIFFAGYASDLIKVLSTVPQSNNILIMGGNTFATTNSYPNPLPDLHNVYFTAFGSPKEWDGTDQKPPFFQEYKDHFGTLTDTNGLSSINSAVMLNYDAISTLLYGSQQVLSTKNTISASDLILALKQITVTNPIQGVTGRIAFDSSGDQDPSKMVFVEHIEGTNLVIDEKHGCLQKDNCGS